MVKRQPDRENTYLVFYTYNYDHWSYTRMTAEEIVDAVRNKKLHKEDIVIVKGNKVPYNSL